MPDISFRISAIHPQNGDALSVGENDIVVFVGANNCGKTTALWEILEGVSNFEPSSERVVIGGVSTEGYERNEIAQWFRNALTVDQRGKIGAFWTSSAQRRYVGRLPVSLNETHIDTYTSREDGDRKLALKQFGGYLCAFFTYAEALAATERVQARDVHSQPCGHPIHYVCSNRAVERTISEAVEAAFGVQFAPDFRPSSKIASYYGVIPPPRDGQDRSSEEYAERVARSAKLLELQGGGVRSFIGTLLNLNTVKAPIVLLDEPEAFLHPPQAKRLGREVALVRQNCSQIFLSTHSLDFLQGVLDGASECGRRVSVVQVLRTGDESSCVSVESTSLSEQLANPVLRASHVADGLFYERTILCEAAGDRVFYEALAQQVSGSLMKSADTFFCPVSGIDSVIKASRVLRLFSCRTSVIVDADIIRDKKQCEKVLKEMGAPSCDIEQSSVLLQTVQEHLNNLGEEPSEPFSASKSRAQGLIQDMQAYSKTDAKAIGDLLSPPKVWRRVKEQGFALFDGTCPDFSELVSIFEKHGIFLVPVGEMESFSPESSGHGPKWIVSLQNRLGADWPAHAELENARQFVAKVMGHDSSSSVPSNPPRRLDEES